MSLSARPLLPSLVLVLPAMSIAAQGRVWIADDAPPQEGALWTLNLTSTGFLASQKEISTSEGTLPASLKELDDFGAAVALLGDLDGNGVVDLAVGAPGDDHGGASRGAVWILFRDSLANIASAQPIRTGEGVWTAALQDGDRFGSALARVGDLDGDGVPELAVGAPGNGGGSVWILFLDTDGTVASELRIGPGAGGFQGGLDAGDRFGSALAFLGDTDGDGLPELAVGAPGDDDGSPEGGALHVLSLQADGVHAQHKISTTSGGFGGASTSEELGSSVAFVGDIDGDGVGDLALGGPGSDLGGTDRGVVWILFLRPDGTVRAQQELGLSTGGVGTFSNERFGTSIAPLGYLDGDSVPDLAVGAPQVSTGEVFLVFLNTNGTCKTFKNVNRVHGKQTGGLFGSSLAYLGDLNLDGRPDIGAGATGIGGAFTPLATALASASDGDALLLQPGTYPGLTLGDKSLTVLAEGDATVDLGPTEIDDLAASKRLELRGLRLSPLAESSFNSFFLPGLSLVNDQGSVWIEACEIPPSNLDPSGPGLQVDHSINVILIETRASGSAPGFLSRFQQSGHGLVILGGSEVVAYGSELRGANGYFVQSSFEGPVPGAVGLLAMSSADRLFLSDVAAIGGNGYSDGDVFGSNCSSGGIGLSTAGVARVLDSRLHGGSGGLSFNNTPCAPDGVDQTGDVRSMRGQALRFSVDSPVREGRPIRFDFLGPPLSPVYLLSSTDPTSLPAPVLRGQRLVETPGLEFVGTTDANGELHLTRTQPELGAGVEFTTTFFQSLCGEPLGRGVNLGGGPGSPGGRSARFVVGAPSMLVALDRSL